MLLSGKDGELRLADLGSGGTTYYFQVLFMEMDFTGPISRPRTVETLKMDRGNMDSNAHYVEENDEPRYAALPFSFSTKLADTVNTRSLTEWISGVTQVKNEVGGVTEIYSFDGTTTIDGNTLPAFKDSGKQTYRVQVLWDGTTDLGLEYKEVYFPPGESSINESADGLTFNVNGQIYGDVTKILAFDISGATYAFV